MRIFYETINGGSQNRKSLEVEASHSIGDIKKQACENEDKATNTHQLKHGIRLLDDTKTVGEEGINENFSLLLALHLPVKLLIISSSHRENLFLDVHTSSTVGQTVSTICERERMAMDRDAYCFYQEGRSLEGRPTLAHYGIIDDMHSLIFMAPSGSRRIYVRILDDKDSGDLTFYAHPHDSIGSLKGRICIHQSLPLEQQKLMLATTGKVLNDRKTLKECGLKQDDVLSMKPDRSIEICIRNQSEPSSGLLKLRVDPADTVSSLKEKLSKEKGIPAEQQRLDFEESFMNDDETLGDLKVKDGAVLDLSTTRGPFLRRQETTLLDAAPPIYKTVLPPPVQGDPPAGLHMQGVCPRDPRMRPPIGGQSVGVPHPVLGGVRPGVPPPSATAGGSPWVAGWPPAHPIAGTPAPTAPNSAVFQATHRHLAHAAGRPADSKGSQTEEMPPPLPPGSLPPSSVQVLVPGQLSLTESTSLAEEAPPPPPPGSPPPSIVQDQGAPSAVNQSTGREKNDSHVQPSPQQSQHDNNSLDVPVENQQQASALRIITDEVTGPHNSPVDEGGQFIDKGTGRLYVRKADASSLPLHVYEQTAPKADNEEDDKESPVHKSPELGVHQGTSAQSFEAEQLHKGQNASSSAKTSNDDPIAPSSAKTSNDEPIAPGSAKTEPMSPGSAKTSNDEPMSPGSAKTSNDEPIAPGSAKTSNDEPMSPGSAKTSNDEPMSPGSAQTSSDHQMSPGSADINVGDDYYLEEGTGDLYVRNRDSVGHVLPGYSLDSLRHNTSGGSVTLLDRALSHPLLKAAQKTRRTYYGRLSTDDRIVRRCRQMTWKEYALVKKARLARDMTRIIDVISAKTGASLEHPLLKGFADVRVGKQDVKTYCNLIRKDPKLYVLPDLESEAHYYEPVVFNCSYPGNRCELLIALDRQPLSAIFAQSHK
ncbi:probable polyubiquitin-B at N-terminal half [Coccomyxa sp. Obi]|nr:probable polyubiquitin-B at N-terminal half [Coccomyxa sp. Obi]